MVGIAFYRMTWEHQRLEAAESRSRQEFLTWTAKDSNCWFRRTTSHPWGLDLGSSSWSPAASDFPCLTSFSLNGISVICGQNKFCHCSVTQSCPTLCDPMDYSTPGFSILHHLLEFAQTHVHWVGDVIQPSHPLLSASPPAFNLSQHQVFSSELALCIRWPKYWGFSFSVSPSNENSGLISFRIDWFDLLAIQGTLKSFLQHHISKAIISQCSTFFMVQLSHPYTTTGKTIALTI